MQSAKTPGTLPADAHPEVYRAEPRAGSGLQNGQGVAVGTSTEHCQYSRDNHARGQRCLKPKPPAEPQAEAPACRWLLQENRLKAELSLSLCLQKLVTEYFILPIHKE